MIVANDEDIITSASEELKFANSFTQYFDRLVKDITSTFTGSTGVLYVIRPMFICSYLQSTNTRNVVGQSNKQISLMVMKHIFHLCNLVGHICSYVSYKEYEDTIQELKECLCNYFSELNRKYVIVLETEDITEESR